MYIAKRLVLLLVIIFFVSVAAFFLVHLLPGNPAAAILGPNDTPQNQAILNHQLGLDRSLWMQYFIWIGHVFQGNLGQSFTTHQTTMSIIAEAFPIDIELIVISQLMALIVAVHWHIFPGPASYVPLAQDFGSNIHTMLLPSIVLALGSIVIYFRLLRNDLIATLQEDFITMARSKGLSDRRIITARSAQAYS